jgi:predicted membrane-bound spermidine synthase
MEKYHVIYIIKKNGEVIYSSYDKYRYVETNISVYPSNNYLKKCLNNMKYKKNK